VASTGDNLYFAFDLGRPIETSEQVAKIFVVL
jgi:hypothetical protein